MKNLTAQGIWDTRPKLERNERLVRTWRSGRYKTISALARQFRISRQAATFIIRRAERRERLAALQELPMVETESELVPVTQ